MLFVFEAQSYSTAVASSQTQRGPPASASQALGIKMRTTM